MRMALLAAAAALGGAAAQDRGGNVLEELITDESGRSAVSVSSDPDADPDADTTNVSPQCTADRAWCALIEIESESDRAIREVFLSVYDGRQSIDEREVWRHALANEDFYEGPRFTLWPRIVRLGNSALAVVAQGEALDSAVLIGVETRTSAGYSGGAASATDLQLLLATRSVEGVKLRRVMNVPVAGWSMIRACFSEDHMAQRAGACHDEYTFEGTLTLDPQGEGMPRFGYQTRATSFPGPVSRSEDSLKNPPLDESDLVTVVDEACSYRRTFVHDPAAGAYRPDSPLPACEDYTVP